MMVEMGDILRELDDIIFKCGVPGCDGWVNAEYMVCSECLVRYNARFEIIPMVVIKETSEKKNECERNNQRNRPNEI